MAKFAKEKAEQERQDEQKKVIDPKGIRLEVLPNSIT